MNATGTDSSHRFHIPVMGTGFTIDTPLKVAKYGISSAISLCDHILIEKIRKYHCKQNNLPYEEIPESDRDARAKRITAYLDLVDNLVNEQAKKLSESPFEPGSEISKYFEFLPDSDLKKSYQKMLDTSDPDEKLKQQDQLRKQIVAGDIDVNIMTKVDRDIYEKETALPQEFSDALSGLRGFAQSKLSSSIVFSAGLNVRLFGYLSNFKDFFPCDSGKLKKKIILKVSDYRSAIIQGKYLAKRGLWVSEYRIESGLNCGGHAFATDGYLIGTILKEFKDKKAELTEKLFTMYNKALTSRDYSPVPSPLDLRITVQGGIGTADENKLLMEHYDVDSTGWGTPFLLVPEATNLDDAHIEKLIKAKNGDVYLSDCSPLGVPFWNLRTSSSEQDKIDRIEIGKPGSPCPKGFLVSNKEFSKVPVCRAARVYQKKKLRTIDIEGPDTDKLVRAVIAKSCLCRDLSGGAEIKYGIDPKATTAVCCGPNIVNFDKIVTLEEMIGHIYGRLSIMSNEDRPHMFLRELDLYIDYLKEEIRKNSEGLIERTNKYYQDFKYNLSTGIDYYRDLSEEFCSEQKEKFLKELDRLAEELEKEFAQASIALSLG